MPDTAEVVLRRRMLLALIATVVVIAAVVVFASIARKQAAQAGSGPLPLAVVDAPAATSTACGTLLAGLPDQLSGRATRILTDPQPGVHAWGDPAIVLRCGINTPAELDCSAALVQIGAVQWLLLQDAGGPATYLAADRHVRVAVTIPDGMGVGPMPELSAVVADALPAQSVCTGNALTPVEGG